MTAASADALTRSSPEAPTAGDRDEIDGIVLAADDGGRRAFWLWRLEGIDNSSDHAEPDWAETEA